MTDQSNSSDFDEPPGKSHENTRPQIPGAVLEWMRPNRLLSHEEAGDVIWRSDTDPGEGKRISTPQPTM